MATQDSYHDTVSKMARKYSQYRLPEPSELLHSDDENNTTNNHLKSRSLNDLHTNNNNTTIHLNDSRSYNNISLEHESNDEEDEDLFSETNTMISHKSYPSKQFLHAQQSSNPVPLQRKTSKVSFGPTTHYNPIEEIRTIQTDKALFIDLFDKYFDESKEGDVDFGEFKKGLFKLGHSGTDQHIQKLFDILLMNGDVAYALDGVECGQYLQSDQFSDFLTRKFDNPQLIAFQELLLNIIIPNTKKNDSRHSLINADDAVQWDAAEVSLTEIEMRQAMEQMVDSEMEKIKKTSEFQEELSRRMADPQFCNDLNAENWDYYEVAYWVEQNGYNYCMKRFFDQQIDGNVLLYDINVSMLVNTLGVTTLHSNKFMRNLYDLKVKINQNKTVLSCDYNICDIYIASNSDTLFHETYENKINDLNVEKKILNEKILALQLDLNETKQKLLNAQQEIVALNKIMQLNNIKLIDYDSMKSLYDSICKQLNDTKIEYQNTKHANESQMELLKKQYDGQASVLKQQISNLSNMNDSLSDENVQLKTKILNVQQRSAAMEEEEKNSLDNIDFDKCEDWNGEEVGYWLGTIGMKKYMEQFVQLDVDGQILMHDINCENLIEDLQVKSIHAPKIIREINKLKNNDAGKLIVIAENVTDFNVAPTENQMMYKLKNDLNALTFETNGQKNNMNVPLALSLSVQSSTYSDKSAAGILPATWLSEHARNESIYSEGDIMLNGNISNIQKYIKELETKNRELSTLFHRADKNLKEYTSAIVPFQQRISSLEAQNEKRKGTIDKLNRRIYRRNQTIKKMEQKRLQQSVTAHYGHQIPRQSKHNKLIKFRHKSNQSGGIRLTQQNLLNHHRIVKLPYDHEYAKSVTSDDTSIVGSLTSLAYGLWGSNNTAGN